MIFAHEFGHQLLSFHASGVLAAACRAPVICANASCTGERGHYGPRGRRFESCGPDEGQGPSSRREGVPFASRTAAEFRSRSLTTGSRRGCHQTLERRPRLLGRHLGAELHRDRGLRVAEDLHHHAGMDVEVDEQGGRPDACRSAPQVSRPADVPRLHGIPYRVVNTRLESCHASPAAARARILQTGAPRLRDAEGRQRQRDVGLLRLASGCRVLSTGLCAGGTSAGTGAGLAVARSPAGADPDHRAPPRRRSTRHPSHRPRRPRARTRRSATSSPSSVAADGSPPYPVPRSAHLLCDHHRFRGVEARRTGGDHPRTVRSAGVPRHGTGDPVT
jgi:hypothetical protein